MNLKKMGEVEKGKANFTFLHHYLTPEGETVKKNKKYWLVINAWVLSAAEIHVSVGFFQPSRNKFLFSISPMCCNAEEKICISWRSPCLPVGTTLLTGFALTFPVCADIAFMRGFVVQSKMDNLLHSLTLSVAAVYGIDISYCCSYSEAVWGHSFLYSAA